MQRVYLAAACAAGMLSFAAPAGAVIYTVTYQGVVTEGFDNGLFGGIGDLAGAGYVAAFTIDTSKGDHSGFPGFASANGYGANSPVMATLTIGGVTVSTGDRYGFIFEMDKVTSGFPDDSQSALGESSEVVCGGGGEDCLTYDRQLLHSAGSSTIDLVDGDFETPPLAMAYGPGVFAGGFFFDRRVIDGSQNLFETRAQARLAPASISVSSAPGAVPEPATWALMIAGFGAAGTALRRRSTSLA